MAIEAEKVEGSNDSDTSRLMSAHKEKSVLTPGASTNRFLCLALQCSYKTLFSVTAGDYDADGIDEIACTDADMGVQMVEIYMSDQSTA